MDAVLMFNPTKEEELVIKRHFDSYVVSMNIEEAFSFKLPVVIKNASLHSLVEMILKSEESKVPLLILLKYNGSPFRIMVLTGICLEMVNLDWERPSKICNSFFSLVTDVASSRYFVEHRKVEASLR